MSSILHVGGTLYFVGFAEGWGKATFQRFHSDSRQVKELRTAVTIHRVRVECHLLPETLFHSVRKPCGLLGKRMNAWLGIQRCGCWSRCGH